MSNIHLILILLLWQKLCSSPFLQLHLKTDLSLEIFLAHCFSNIFKSSYLLNTCSTLSILLWERQRCMKHNLYSFFFFNYFFQTCHFPQQLLNRVDVRHLKWIRGSSIQLRRQDTNTGNKIKYKIGWSKLPLVLRRVRRRKNSLWG